MVMLPNAIPSMGVHVVNADTPGETGGIALTK